MFAYFFAISVDKNECKNNKERGIRFVVVPDSSELLSLLYLLSLLPTHKQTQKKPKEQFLASAHRLEVSLDFNNKRN